MNLDDAFEIVIAETRDRFGGREMRHLNGKELKQAVMIMADLGVLNLREAVNKMASATGRSRIWVYNVLRERDSMIDLSNRNREETLK